jgi:hypothetical protein
MKACVSPKQIILQREKTFHVSIDEECHVCGGSINIKSLQLQRVVVCENAICLAELGLPLSDQAVRV